MLQYIDKDALLAWLKERIRDYWSDSENTMGIFPYALEEVIKYVDTLEVIDPYEQCVQYDSIKAGIQAHAETYSFNIESKLFNQLTKEQQELWRKEIEQACISGGEVGVEFARDPRYKENLEVKEVDLEKEARHYLLHEHSSPLNEIMHQADLKAEIQYHEDIENAYKAGFELGLKAQKGE